MVYGNPIPAPWNTSKNGEASSEKDKDAAPKLFPDAALFATWDFEQKRYDQTLPVARKPRGGTINVHAPGKRARGESKA